MVTLEDINVRVSRLEGGYEHLATKADVAEVKSDIAGVEARMAEFEGKVNSRFAEMEAKAAEFRSEVNSRFAKIDARFAQMEAKMNTKMAQLENRIILKLGGLGIALTGVLIAAIRFLG